MSGFRNPKPRLLIPVVSQPRGIVSLVPLGTLRGQRHPTFVPVPSPQKGLSDTNQPSVSGPEAKDQGQTPSPSGPLPAAGLRCARTLMLLIGLFCWSLVPLHGKRDHFRQKVSY